MDYIVNDIENILLLNKLGVFELIISKCSSMTITNIRINDFSFNKQREINLLKEKGLKEVETSLELYNYSGFCRKSSNELGDDDLSS